MHRWATLVILFIVGSIAVPAMAGSLDRSLEQEIELLGPGEKVTAVVVMESQAPVEELSRALTLARATRAERHETIIRALQDASSSQDDLVAWLEGAMREDRVEGYTTYWIVNAVVVRASGEAIREIAGRSDVAQVRKNPVAQLIEPVDVRNAAGGLRDRGATPGQVALGASRVWNELGITGHGRLVSNLDTGVAGNHPALMERWRGNNGHPWQECWLDVLGEDTTYPEDSGSHGTHTMGTITGLGAATQDSIGVAWGAQWIACNVIGQGVGSELDNDVMTAFQWIADPDGDPQTIDDVPDVVQNSWRINEQFGGDYTDCDDRWWAVIDNCEAAGCVVIFSAGNEGPGAETIGSPPDRATTPVNCFAVGAVDATNNPWPYPIAGFSSRGPTGCDVAPELKIKPEAVAPGVDVFSSIPSGYGYMSGTSMAGPHVSGIVGLMREANPDLEVDTIKQILLDTARDEGDPGEENTYGWGFVDAYAAVLAALDGTGELTGNVVNATEGGAPLQNATVTLSGSAAHYPTDAAGDYRGHALAGVYTATADHPSFAPESFEVTIDADGVTVQDFSLVDDTGPAVSNVTDPRTIPDDVGPYGIDATITDYSTILGAAIVYRIDGGDWNESAMTGVDDQFSGEIPGQDAGSTIDFYVRSEDNGGNVGTFPADAPASYRTFYITVPALVDDAEGDQGWSLGWFGDTATQGIWVREDPVGTWVGSRPSQPEDDHTADPGHICFVTGNGEPGGSASAADVDGGCTSLVSPLFDLSEAQDVFVYYWRWFAQFGLPGDSFSVQVSNNNGGAWTDLEVVDTLQNEWTEVFLMLGDYIELTASMRVRFIVCDSGYDSTIEGAVDDVSIEVLPGDLASTPASQDLRSGLSLSPARPNPTHSSSRIGFRLSIPSSATLDLYDAEGRHIRSLLNRNLGAGAHEVVWDGRDDAGRDVGAGVYYYRLRAGAFEQSSRVSLVR